MVVKYHFFNNIIWCLLNTNRLTDTLCVEFQPILNQDIEEATKVALFEDVSIKRIGKELNIREALQE